MILSFSSLASVCELTIKLNQESNKLILSLKDSENAGADDDLVVKFMGGNPERKNCAELKADLAGRKLEAEIDGEMMPIVIEDISACNVESARSVAMASLPESASEIYGTKGKEVNGSFNFVLNYDADGFRVISMVAVQAKTCVVEKKTSTALEALSVFEEETTDSEDSIQ